MGHLEIISSVVKLEVLSGTLTGTKQMLHISTLASAMVGVMKFMTETTFHRTKCVTFSHIWDKWPLSLNK